MAPSPSGVSPSRAHLARAGWAIINSTSLSTVEAPPANLNAEGARLVAEVAAAWTSKFRHTIRQLGPHGGAYHYECIFSCPASDTPVPCTILCTKFALVVPPAQEVLPRLLYSFEEGDLRHEWGLQRDDAGHLCATVGPQAGSLADGSFESYLDRLVQQKDTLRSSGVSLTTSFEETRLPQPPSYSCVDSDEESATSLNSSGQGRAEECPAVLVTNTSHPHVAEEKSKDTFDTEEMRTALGAAGLLCDKVAPPSSMSELLTNIFDAADEDSAGELPHYEVARLLGATLLGFGLEIWDIHLLLTSAQENDDGFIECKPFIQAAPEIIRSLWTRRLSYRNRGLPGVEIPAEAVKHCFNDEVTETANCLLRVFEQCASEDTSRAKWHQMRPVLHRGKSRMSLAGGQAQVGVSIQPYPDVFVTEGQRPAGQNNNSEEELAAIRRCFCQECVSALPERVSPQEAQRLMQMLPEDDEGFVYIEDVAEHLEHLRTEALLNALVESDILLLRTHLVLRFRHLGLGSGKIRIWQVKYALLSADQICLSRLQIHVLLCLADVDSQGYVEISHFLAMCCVVIPHMFNAKTFVSTAERLINEHADATRRSENAELAALGAARVGTMGQDGEEKSQECVVDQETVERTLLQVITLNDDQHRSPPALPPDTIFNILFSGEKEVQNCQLSDCELGGLVAEMTADADGLVAYVEFIKKWVPVVFELRRNPLLCAYLQEGSAETLGIPEPDLVMLEGLFPLYPEGQDPKYQGRASQGRLSRRNSLNQSRRDSLGRRSMQMQGDEVSKLASSIDKNSPTQKRNLRGNMLDPADAEGGQRRLSEDRRKTSKSRYTLDQLEALRREAKEPPPGRGFARRKLLLTAATPGSNEA